MAIIEDDMNVDPVHSFILDYLNSNLGDDASYPNDLAWADSCLNNDLGTSNTDWASIKDVLFEILSSQSEPPDSVAAENHTQLSINKDRNFSDYVASLSLDRESDDDDEDLIDDVIGDIESINISDDDEGNLRIANKKGKGKGKRSYQNVFRPTYTEDIVKVASNDTGMDPSVATWEVESSSEDIFKVWDLGIPEEEDDFTKQLEKANADFPLPIQQNPDDSTAWKDATYSSVDDLIAGMDDLSLKQNTRQPECSFCKPVLASI